ncbi:hypothetical protein EVAR_90500_1 [Eumeta japonica]|uniref:RNase H type-1 domain-containing protein n=1 Tax=Eumeta variegata TaxID=151549 RepID=A0A4C2AAK0_EUMVA|nr:hypothetical protein EVAR_90500_1 [Eumeta japonica]
MVLTKKLKYDDPVVHMNGERISSVGEIRLLGLSPSGQGDVGSESGDREDHIHYRDRAYRSVRFVRLGTDEEARRAKMLDAVQRSVALKACRAHRTVSLHSALILARLLPLDIRVREVAWLYEVKRGKDLGDTFVDRELERPVYFGDLPHPAHVPEIGYESVEDLDPRRWTVAVVGPRISPTVAASKAKSGGLTGGGTVGAWYSTLRLDPFCTVFQAEMVALQRAIRRRDISEIVAEGRAVRLFWVRAHAGIAETSVRTSSPGARPHQRRQRTMTGFRCRTRGWGGEPGRVAGTIRRGRHR